MPRPSSRFDTHPKARLSTFEAKAAAIKLGAIPMILQKNKGLWTVKLHTGFEKKNLPVYLINNLCSWLSCPLDFLSAIQLGFILFALKEMVKKLLKILTLKLGT